MGEIHLYMVADGNKDHFNYTTPGFSQLYPKTSLKQTHKHKIMHCWVNISFYPWHCFSSQERKQHEAKFKPNADIILSSKWTHWGASQLHLLGPPKRPHNNKPHSGASLNFILRILHLIYICLISAKSKCHTRQGLYNRYTHWAITWLDWVLSPCEVWP